MSEHELIDELRAGRFDAMASAELRARVREIAAEAPPRRSLVRRHLSWRRATLVFAPACLAALAAAAILQGVVSSGGEERDAARVRLISRTVPEPEASWKSAPLPSSPSGTLDPSTYSTIAVPGRTAFERKAALAAPPTHDARTLSSATLPSGRRLVDYRVQMRLRVDSTDDLSNATVRAMRVARSLGGYVVNVDYSTPGARSGDAVLVLRVPTRQMQTALLRLSNLGTIVSQAVSLVDLQKAFNKEAARIGKLGTEVGRLRSQLDNLNLSAEERARIEEQLEYLALQLRAATRQHKATKERGNLGTIRVALTTAKKKQQVVPAVPDKPTRFDRAMDDAGAILARELTWGLYAAIVGFPFALLLALALFSEKGRRRRSERRLLARA